MRSWYRRIAHIAALSLMGWYFLVPPLYNPNRQELAQIRNRWDLPHTVLRTDWPYSDWKILGSYDAASACEAARDRNLEFIRGVFEREKKTRPQTAERLMDGAVDTRCIASDDPKLK
jgi:hypothetical protein